MIYYYNGKCGGGFNSYSSNSSNKKGSFSGSGFRGSGEKKRYRRFVESFENISSLED